MTLDIKSHPISVGALRYAAPRRVAAPVRVTETETNIHKAGSTQAERSHSLAEMARKQAETQARATGLYPRAVAMHRSVDLPLYDSAGNVPVDLVTEGFVPRSLGTTMTSRGVLGTVVPNPGLHERQPEILRAIQDRKSDVYVEPAWVKTV